MVTTASNDLGSPPISLFHTFSPTQPCPIHTSLLPLTHLCPPDQLDTSFHHTALDKTSSAEISANKLRQRISITVCSLQCIHRWPKGKTHVGDPKSIEIKLWSQEGDTGISFTFPHKSSQKLQLNRVNKTNFLVNTHFNNNNNNNNRTNSKNCGLFRTLCEILFAGRFSGCFTGCRVTITLFCSCHWWGLFINVT